MSICCGYALCLTCLWACLLLFVRVCLVCVCVRVCVFTCVFYACMLLLLSRSAACVRACCFCCVCVFNIDMLNVLLVLRMCLIRVAFLSCFLVLCFCVRARFLCVRLILCGRACVFVL